MRIDITLLTALLLFDIGPGMAQQDILTSEQKSVEKIEAAVVGLVREKQDEHVKDSVDKDNAFTEADYEAFNNGQVVSGIVDKLKNEEIFKTIVADIAQLDVYDRRRIYTEASGTYKKTWREIGRIAPEGQSEAGSKAEKEIAAAIRQLLEDSVKTKGAR